MRDMYNIFSNILILVSFLSVGCFVIWYLKNQKIRLSWLLITGLILWFLTGGLAGYLIRFLTE